MITKVLIITLLIFSFSLQPLLAFNDPSDVPNNKFGIHIFNEEDLIDASKLVNSNGGDWGYVTFVVSEKERNTDRWQKAFDKMRRLHLIPIVRIATKQTTKGWSKPEQIEIEKWISFLNSLNWVTKNRYIIIGNEVNHAAEWGGEIDPEGYATYLKTFITKLRETSSDYFILAAALDASAGASVDSMDESLFLRQMLEAEPNIFDFIDGWNSHSYPNPDFSGKETDEGRGSVRTYDWEITFLKTLGVSRDFPIFITETGWSNKNLSENEIGAKLKYAFDNAWFDKRIVAVTPFILNYPVEPFKDLSWKKENGDYHSFYEDIQKAPKILGKPTQVESGEIIAAFSQPLALVGSDYLGVILARNNGQAIWSFEGVSIGSENGAPFIKSYSFNDLEPGHLGIIIYRAISSKRIGLNSSLLYLQSSDSKIITNKFPVETIALNVDKMKISRYFGTILSGLRLKGP